MAILWGTYFHYSHFTDVETDGKKRDGPEEAETPVFFLGLFKGAWLALSGVQIYWVVSFTITDFVALWKKDKQVLRYSPRN